MDGEYNYHNQKGKSCCYRSMIKWSVQVVFSRGYQRKGLRQCGCDQTVGKNASCSSHGCCIRWRWQKLFCVANMFDISTKLVPLCTLSHPLSDVPYSTFLAPLLLRLLLCYFSSGWPTLSATWVRWRINSIAKYGHFNPLPHIMKCPNHVQTHRRKSPWVHRFFW